jgi:FkbM family methyltransferase
MYYALLKELFETSDNVYNNRLVSKNIFNGKPIVIYGVGKYGKIIYRYLMDAPPSRVCYADEIAVQNDLFVDNIPVIPLYDIANKLGKDTNIIVTPKIIYKDKTKNDEFIKSCYAIGLSNLYFINLAGCDAWNMISRISKDECLNVIDLLCDDVSKEHYYGYIRNVLRCEYASENFINKSELYFPDDLFSIYETDFLVDCGAYTGDTIVQILHKYPYVRGIASFEPTPILFKQLQCTVDSYNPPLADIKIFEMAVGNENQMVNLSLVPSRGANSIQKEGTLSVQCCTLDDTVLNFHPTYIKMDIEGSELSALQGAKKLIDQLKPILAICIYHKPEDLFEIPLFVLNCFAGYRLYIRKYGCLPNNDLVLYAVPPGRILY